MTTAEYEMKRQKDERKLLFRRILLIAAILIVVITIITIAFNRFKLYSDARIALREAKNIKITLEMADIEYYSTSLNIFDDTAEGNLRKGVIAYVNRIQDNPKGIIRLTGYDSEKRQITGLEYELENYIVRYFCTEDGDCWQVCQIKELLNY